VTSRNGGNTDNSWLVYIALFIIPPILITSVFGLDRWYALLWIILAFGGLLWYLSQNNE
jgi:hypothetical protein